MKHMLISVISFLNFHLVAAMSSATVLESEATFQMQAQRAGLSQSYIDCIKAAALGTLGKLAYALTTPGTSPTELQVNNFLNAMRPAVAPTVADTTAMKRIIFLGADSHDSQLAQLNAHIG